jgi:hypothetical protein
MRPLPTNTLTRQTFLSAYYSYWIRSKLGSKDPCRTIIAAMASGPRGICRTPWSGSLCDGPHHWPRIQQLRPTGVRIKPQHWFSCSRLTWVTNYYKASRQTPLSSPGRSRLYACKSFVHLSIPECFLQHPQCLPPVPIAIGLPR